MPTYEYECTHCGYSFEVFQKISDPALDKCPQCQKKVRRLIGSGGAIIFKGKNKTCPNAQTKEECRCCPASNK